MRLLSTIQRHPQTALFLSGAVIGLLLFLYLFGFQIVLPSNINWVLNSNGDMVQHYIGWEYFRQSSWHFPNIGKIDGLAYPSGISLIYMDVIPLFAIFFKLFSGLLPHDFQYLGLFTLMSFALFGGFSTLIVSRFTKKTVIILITTLLMLCTPLLFGRVFAHTALTAQWLVLAALYATIVFYQTKPCLRTRILVWSVLLSLAVLIHAYFIPIVGCIFAASLVLEFKNIKTTIVSLLIPATIALVLFAMIGGLSRGMQGNGDPGLGLYSTNILAPVIPMGYSSIFSSNFTHVQWEGLGYLGLGLLLLAPLAWFVVLRPGSSMGRKFTSSLTRTQKILLLLIALGTFMFSLGPFIYLGDANILNISPPHIAVKLWETFRSTGRMFWPLYYALVIAIIVCVILATQRWKTKFVVILLVPFLFLQSMDILLSSAVQEKRAIANSSNTTSHTPDELNKHFIDTFCNKRRVIVADNSLEAGVVVFEKLSDYIAICRPELTTGYFARFPKKSILNYADIQRAGLVNGTLSLSDDSLYITTSSDFVHEINPDAYKSENIGGIWVITGRPNHNSEL